MNSFSFHRNKFALAGSGVLIGTLATSIPSLHYLGAGIFFYNFLERIDILEIDMHPDMILRKLHLSQLLKHHLLKAESLNRWITEDTLMIAKPVTYFDDQGLLGWGANKLGLNPWKSQPFIMKAGWKDAKYYGEGTAYCVGQFVNLQNYYFKSITVEVTKPRAEKYIILDDNSIDI